MCEFSEKLMAWLDQELPAEESTVIDGHVRACAECRREVLACRELSETMDAYCDAAILASARSPERATPRMVRRAFVGTAAVAAAVLLVFLTVSQRVWRMDSASSGVLPFAQKPPLAPAELEKSAPVETYGAQMPRKIRKPLRPLDAKRGENPWPEETPVYIAIPADALFPPGALPDGVGFVADVSLRSDGSAQRLRLQPQLVGFKRRGTQP